jgi:hypothetical protein
MSKRKDISEEMKAEIYMKMNKRNEQMEQELKLADKQKH